MPRVIALTGATGFIGGAVAHRLKAANWQIRALVRPTSTADRFPGIGVRWIEGDLGDLESLRRLVRGTEAVVHCAGAVRGVDSEHFARANSSGVARLAQAASEQRPPPSFLLLSSVAAREPHLSPYAASKRQGEEALAAGAGKMKWVALRPPAVYGLGDKELLPLFRWMYRGIAPVLGTTDGRFSLLYVDDLADAVMHWLEYGCAPQGVFELHDGKPNGYGWNDLADTMARLRGKKVYRVKVPPRLLTLLAMINAMAARVAGFAPMLTPGKARELRHPDWVCDNTPLSRETGWAPLVSLEEGLRRTLESDR
jgi:nucleoside-diphosphate-sugar epimerase